MQALSRLRSAASLWHFIPVRFASQKAARDLMPSVIRLLHESGLKASDIKPTGPLGHILKSDVLAAMKNQKSGVSRPQPTQAVSQTQIAKPSAASLAGNAKTRVPHIYLTDDVVLDKVVKTLALGKSKYDLSHVLARAAASALQAVPEANCVYIDGEVKRLPSIDVSIEVAFVTNANVHLSLDDVAEAANKEGARAAGDRYCSVSVSSCAGSRVIPAAHSALLTVGSSSRKVVATETGTKVASVAPVAFTFDGRAITEDVAARFLESFKQKMEIMDKMHAKQ